MSEQRDMRSNNLRAGVFVSLTLLLLIAVILVLANAKANIFQSNNDYQATFTVQQGVGALASGSAVRLGGVKMGKVKTVGPKIGDDGTAREIIVSFKLDSSITLHDDASVQVRSGMLGNASWLEISNVGRGTVATSDTVLQGSIATMLTQILGTESEMDIQQTLDALRRVSAALASDGGGLRVLLGEQEAGELRGAVTAARKGLESFGAIVSSAEVSWPTWSDAVTTLLADGAKLPSRMDATLAKVQDILVDLHVDVLPKVEESIDGFLVTMQAMRKRSPQWADDVSGTLENAHQISSRAKAAIDDIAASPWRLLYRPTDREMAYEQLNDASWRLLYALTDLRATAAAMQEAAGDDAQLQLLAEQLAQSESDFAAARTAVMERIAKDFPKRLRTE